MGTREGTFGLLALGSETTKSTVVSLDIETTRFFLEFIHAEFDESVVKVLTSQVGVSVGCLYFEDSIFNGEERDIEGATAKIKDKNIAFT